MVARQVAEGKLTDVQIRAWMRARAPVAKSDGGGLTFTLSRAGTASWVLRYSLNGARSELTLGNYPDMKLSDARKLAREKRVEIDRGMSPAVEKQRQKAEMRMAILVKDGVLDYEAKKLPALSSSTNRTYTRQLKRITALLGKIPAKDVEPHHIVSLLERHKHRGWRETETLLIVARELFAHISGKAAIGLDPCGPVSLTAIAGERPAPRTRLMLTSQELALTMNAPLSRENQLCIRILLATCVRGHELWTAKLEDIHIDETTLVESGAGLWHVPASKMGPGIDIPLAPPVVEWFRELIELAGDSIYLLPARTVSRLDRHDGDAPISKDTLRAAVLTWLEESRPPPPVRRFTPHDLRSTAKSYLRALKVPRDISEMCLNHKLRGVEGIYDRYSYWPERRDALEKLANYLVETQGRDAGSMRVARRAIDMVHQR